MTSFADIEALELTLGREFDADQHDQINELLEQATGYLRSIIGMEVTPKTTSTYLAYPSGGREDLPQWPIHSVDAVTTPEGVPVAFEYRPGYIRLDSDDPVEVTFTWGLEVAPSELKRLTIVLVSQVLTTLEQNLGLTAGGISSLSIDDFKVAFADAGEWTGIALPEITQQNIRQQFGRGSVSVMDTSR